MIEVVIFDLGNVILPVDGFRLAKRLTPYSPLDEAGILKSFLKIEIVNDFETGRISGEEFFHRYSEDAQLSNLDYPKFQTLFNDIFDEDGEMVNLLPRLKEKTRLGLISNTNKIHADFFLNRYPFFDHFEKLWLSHEVGIRKPDPAIYQTALNHFGVPAERTVFVDDLPENIDGAKHLGINSILFKNYNQLTQDLASLGVRI